MKKDLGLYIHIPFCIKKCDYCDFLSWKSTEKEREDYVRALEKEIKSYRAVSYTHLTLPTTSRV
mgnify:CR=1 FL=1